MAGGLLDLVRPALPTVAWGIKEGVVRGTVDSVRRLGVPALGLVLAIAAACPMWGADDPPDLSGRWALVEVMPGVADLPFVGHVELTTISGLFVDIGQDGCGLSMTQTYAFIDVEMHPAVVKTTVPEVFVSCLPSVVQTATLRRAAGGWAMSGATLVQVRGAHLAGSEGDPLPTSPDDSRVVDEDGDGHPGLTVHVRLAGIVSGNTYVIQRLTTALRGTVEDANTVTGTVDWTGEEIVLAASNPLLKMSYTYEPDPTSSENVFVMRRVDATWTAQTLRDHLPDLLARAGVQMAASR